MAQFDNALEGIYLQVSFYFFIPSHRQSVRLGQAHLAAGKEKTERGDNDGESFFDSTEAHSNHSRSGQKSRMDPKTMYSPVFTRRIWFPLLCVPVIVSLWWGQHG